MFKNKILIFIILVIALLSIGVASAEESSINATDTVSLDDSSTEVVTSANDENTSLDVMSRDNIETSHEDVTFSNENTESNKDTTFSNMLANKTTTKSFTELNNTINSANDIKLDSNYKMTADKASNFTNGITISKNIAIGGNGFTIDANKLGRIFNINAGYTVSLTNVILANGSSGEDAPMLNDTQVNLISDDSANIEEVNSYEMDDECISLKYDVDYKSIELKNDVLENDCAGEIKDNNFESIDYSGEIKEDGVLGIYYDNELLGGSAYSDGITFSVDDIEYGEVAHLHITGKYINYHYKVFSVFGYLDGNQVINNRYLTGKSINVKLDFKNLSIGTHTVMVSTGGDYHTFTFKVKKHSTTISTITNNIKFGQTEKVAVFMGNNIDGLVVFKLTGSKNETKDINLYNTKEFSISFTDLPVGSYKLTTSYLGNDYWSPVSCISTFNVTLDVQLPTIFAGSNATINVQLPNYATGTVSVIIINDETYDKTYDTIVGENGLATITTDKLSGGTFKVYTYYSGDDYYPSASDDSNLVVSKIVTPIEIIAPKIVDYGDIGKNINIMVKIVSNATGIVNINVGNKTYKRTVDDEGVVSVITEKLAVGKYTITANYSGDENYECIWTTADLIVRKNIYVDYNNGLDTNNGTSWINAFKTITKAMSIVSYNDNIYLADGTHIVNNSISIYNAVTIIGNGSKTVITSNGKNRVFGISGDDVAIYNSTFVNNFDASGGAIHNSGSGLLVSGCIFINNSAWVLGGAIYNSGFGLLVSDCTFINNSAYMGGAIHNSGSGLLVNGCTFINNSVSDSGGAIYIAHDSESSITDSIFDNNTENNGVIFNMATLSLNNNEYLGISEGKTYIYNGGTLSSVVVTVLDNKTLTVKEGNTISLHAVITCDGASVDGKNLKFIINDNYYNARSNINGSYIASYDVDLANLEEVVSASYDGASNIIVNTGILTYKLDPELNITVEDITYGKDLIISGNITKSIIGNVTITINNTLKYNTTISDDGKIHYIVPDLGTGEYKITAKYEGNEKYIADEVTKIINVNPTKANLEINIANVTYGEASTITVKLTGVNNTKLNGTITITINDNNYTANIVNGTGTSDKIKLPAGEYQFSAIWNSNNNNYTDTKAYGSFNVSKANLNIDIKANSIKVEQNATITITGLANATGNIIIKVDNKTYEVKIENGIATKEIANLNTGNYTLNVTYNGDNNYNPTVASSNFTVAKLATNINFKAKNITYGENATLTILNLPKDTTGTITIIFEDDEIISDIADEIFISNLGAGNHTISAKYSGDNKYLESNITHNISVAKADSKLNVNIKDINYGEILDITATLNGVNNTSLNGIVKVEINEKIYSIEIKKGICIYDDIKLPVGMYEFTATWEGNTNYTGATFNGKFNIAKINPTIKVDTSNVKIEENTMIIVTFPEDATGNVTITVDGENYIADIEKGIATKNITINKAGNYTVAVVYNGDNNYNTIKDNANFTVSKISNYNITINTENITVSQSATIKVTLPNDINEEITIAINTKNYSTTVKDGIAIITVSDLSAGEHEVVINFENDKYAQKEVNTTFKVSKISDYSINITVPEVIWANESATIIVNLPEDANGNVTIFINNTRYIGIAKNGTVNITIQGLATGEYNATISYGGNDKYSPTEANKTIDVIKADKNVNLISNDVVMIYHDESRLYAILLDSLGNPIVNTILTFTINGITYNRTTNENGSASIAINLEVGNYTATITYLGNDSFNPSSVNSTVTIKTSIIANDIVKMYQNNTQFYAKFIKADGKALTNTNVTFNINGIFYTRGTDSNGTAKLTINLNPGNYTITAYNPETGEQQGFNILVKSLIEASDLTKYYNNESKFQAKIYNKDGSLAINKSVTFNINGALYTRETNENGVVNLAINLRSGNYTITTIYDGLSVGNHVNVLSTLITNDLTMSYHDGSIFNAIVLNSQGKALSNQTVKFNVNGVFYNKISDENGVASLNINLNKGNYIITSIWDEYQVGNKITIS